MKLIIVRHGETEENKQGILQGHMPGTLSRAGIEQGKKLAKRLKDEKIDAIFSSDLKRAAETGKLISKHYPNIRVIYTKKLREWDAGDFTGKISNEIEWKNPPANAETIDQIKKRAKNFLDNVYQEYPGKTVLFISHGGYIKTLVSYIMGFENPLEDVKDQLNTAVNIFEIYEDRSHKIHCLNCIKHLEKDNFKEE